MVLINYATKEIVAKVVYYGPALCGKTTNLQYIYTKLNPKKRGKMISLATEADRTLFFDFLPMELGRVQGFRVRFQLYTVPGQVFYASTRKLVLKGADAIVFVADSQEAVLDRNIESIEDMKENLRENGLDPETMPLVMQYNKRDLDGIMEVPRLEREVNWRGVPYTEAVAVTGPGVMDTFKQITRELIAELKRKHAFMDTGALKELPPDVFEEPKEPEPEFLEAEDVVFEIEHGSGYHEEAGEEVVAGELLDMVETITLADASQAETFFDNVRQGSTAEEAREKALEVEAAETEGGIELSPVTGAGEIEVLDREARAEAAAGATETVLEPEPSAPYERELTPEELESFEDTGAADSSSLMKAFEETLAAEPAPVEPGPPEPPRPTSQARPAPAKKVKPAAPAPARPAAPPAPPPEPETKAAPPPPGPADAPPKQAAPETEKRFDELRLAISALAGEISTISAKLDRPAAPPEAPQAVAPAGLPDELSEHISDVKRSLERIEQEVSGLRLAFTLFKDSAPSGQAGAPALEELMALVKETAEGQDRLMLSILEAARETRQANSDAHEKLQDALEYIGLRLREEGKGGKKKWI